MSRSSGHSQLRASRSSSRRPQASRAITNTSIPSDPQGIVQGVFSEQEAELLHDFVHPHHYTDETLIGEERDSVGEVDEVQLELQLRSRLPWWKRPSPVWILIGLPLSSMAFSMTLAPQVEIYTQLVCAAVNPELFRDQFPEVHSPVNVSESSYKTDWNPTSHNSQSSINVYFSEISHNDDKSGRSKCASDPKVVAATAQLNAIMLTTKGVLGCLTTAWWGSLSDRVGRTTVLSLAIAGILSTDVVFLLVYFASDKLPGGYRFLIVGPILDGLVGGLSASMAAMHAYFADTTTSATRSRIFSLSMGLIFTGMGIGPTLGGLVIRFSGQPVTVFYIATAIHALYAFLVLFVVPESLTQTQRRAAREKYKLMNTLRDDQSRLMFWGKRALGFLSPLTVLVSTPTTKSSKVLPRDWNLLLVALAYGFTVVLFGSYTYKFQYAAAVFGWTSEIIGYWLSIVGVTRAVFLTVVIPLVIRFFVTTSQAAPVRDYDTEPLLSSEDNDNDNVSTSSGHLASRSSRPVKHTSSFDLGLARFSLLVDASSYTLMALATHPLPFVIASIWGSFGGGFSPSIQSVALELYMQRGGTESGRLFGALSVVQALSSQIIGPSLYGFIFMQTIGVFPTALLWTSVLFLTISFILLAFVKLPKPEQHANIYDADEVGDLVSRDV